MSASPLAAVPAPVPRCGLCGCKLAKGVGDDLAQRLCRDHKSDPRATQRGPGPQAAPAAPRAFTQADKALIKSLHGHMPAIQLLELLNARLAADAGDRFQPYTLEQLHAEMRAIEPAAAAAGDWGSLRKLLAQARRSGVLASMAPQVIDDFAVVYQLSPAQHMRLKDVIRDAKEVS